MKHWMTGMLGKRRAYRRIFHGDDGVPNMDAEVVLADLRKFCDRPDVGLDLQGRIDPYQMAYRAGRREVFRRIVEYLNIDDARLVAMMQSMENINE